MLRWALIFLVIAITAGVMGYSGIAGTSTDVARRVCVVSTVLFVLFLAAGVSVERKMDGKL